MSFTPSTKAATYGNITAPTFNVGCDITLFDMTCFRTFPDTLGSMTPASDIRCWCLESIDPKELGNLMMTTEILDEGPPPGYTPEPMRQLWIRGVPNWAIPGFISGILPLLNGESPVCRMDPPIPAEIFNRFDKLLSTLNRGDITAGALPPDEWECPIHDTTLVDGGYVASFYPSDYEKIRTLMILAEGRQF